MPHQIPAEVAEVAEQKGAALIVKLEVDQAAPVS
jgi:hypothetical protein